MNNFNRQFYTDLRIPNKVRDLWVQKKDEAGNPLAGAEFTLYSDADCTMPVAKGVTDAKGYISFSAENTGNNAATDPDGGLSSHVQYALALNRDATTDELSEKKLWLKETKPPKDYDCNETVTEVLITDDYLYVNAGTTYDNVSVARGVGRLVETMARYASDGVVDITLRDVLATNYKYIGASDDQGFPINIEANDSWMQDSEPMKLHYDLNTALLDYGLHDGNFPTFEVEEDWYGIGVEQNWGAHDNKNPDDPYYNPTAIDSNLNGANISALFTGSTIIIYKDKKSTPGSDPKTGDLIVSKTFAGNKGDKNRDWSFVVKLDKNISGTYGEMTFTDGVSVFTLKHGESKTATALPVGMKYTVTEAEANQDEYTTSATGARGTIVENESVASFVNTKGDDKPSTPKGDLTISKTVLGTAGDKTKDWNFIVTLDDTSVNGIYGDMEFTIKECQINDIRRNLKSR